MKLALIPPLSQLVSTKHTDYQLMLPQMLRSLKYADTYLRHCQDPQQYVILDNGAAEDEQFDWEQLTMIAEHYPVNEIVVPDVMGDAEATLKQAVDVYSAVQDAEDVPWKAGVVATGCDTQQAYDMIRTLVEDCNVVYPVVYLPRLLVTRENPFARIDLLILLHTWMRRQNDFNVEFHLLGASPHFPKELIYAADTRYARGMDTSMPFNYGYEGTYINTSVSVSRPDNYFGLEFDDVQELVAEDNVHTMMRWAAETDGA